MTKNIFDIYELRVIRLHAAGWPKELARVLASGLTPCDRYGPVDVPLDPSDLYDPADASPLRRKLARYAKKVNAHD